MKEIRDALAYNAIDLVDVQAQIERDGFDSIIQSDLASQVT